MLRTFSTDDFVKVWLILLLLCTLSTKQITFEKEKSKLTSVPSEIPSEVTKINLKENILTSIPDRCFSRFTNLTSVSLDKNKITDVSTTAFQGLAKVKEISLANNLLPSIPALESVENSLVNLYESPVQNIDFSNNKIAVLNPGLFENCTKLVSLKLESNQLTVLPDGVFGPAGTSLRYLSLKSNKLNTVENGTFAYLTNLHELYMENNQFKEFPMEISKLVSIRKLFPRMESNNQHPR
ncbi:hypothetical protein CAPTEDRAFT_95098 [Capitella teleta]|uniref:LRRNT domain-containing protein n=1 Tax=Capitella teleta TaxID=283909 RepID=R7TYS0_CAPTE|nr:hypothetical protein CAPTEDRAFT_95098 [Capitella teleta]|eukprot:ELT96571.1 hypothetical protein CAPTEDRAFT_95098 [Capitella teleta]